MSAAEAAAERLLGVITADAGSFQFFQLLRLLEQAFPEILRSGAARAPTAPLLRLRAHRGLGFPASQIRSAERTGADGRTLELALTFSGLYGVDSPLPAYFARAAAADEAGALRDFLDIFAHRLYVLLYESWKKTRPALDPAPAGAAAHEARLLALAGIVGAPLAPPLTPGQLLSHAGVLRTAVRTAAGLRRLVAEALPGVVVSVQENVPRWVPLPARPRLGRLAGQPGGPRAVLGRTAVVGRRVLDAAGHFRLELGPVGWAAYERLLPGAEDARRVAALAALYAPDALEYDVELRLTTADVPPTALGRRSNHLGRTARLNGASRPVLSRVVRYAAPAGEPGERAAGGRVRSPNAA